MRFVTERHIPVLREKVLEVCSPKSGEVFADLTAGYGGHAQMLLKSVGDSGFGYIFDKDPDAIKALRVKFNKVPNVAIEHTDFSTIDWEHLPKLNIILLDLGVSSPQLDNTSRGFSFSKTAPLDMRMDYNSELTATHIINSYTQKDLADIIFHFGGEHKSRKIASEIVKQRVVTPITTTTQLSDIITRISVRSKKIHPATKTFQALRIATNNELNVLEYALNHLPSQLCVGGRIAIISFHSLEDRLVKQAFKSLCVPQKDEFGKTIEAPNFKLVTKKPIKGREYDKSNPRARSAMLRAVEKIK